MSTVDKVIARWGGNPYGQHSHIKNDPSFKSCKPENMLYHFGIQVTLVELRIREQAQDFEWCAIVKAEIERNNKLHRKHLPTQVEHTIAE